VDWEPNQYELFQIFKFQENQVLNENIKEILLQMEQMDPSKDLREFEILLTEADKNLE